MVGKFVDRFLHYRLVIIESWDVGNNYVGKYSNLTTLEETYLLALEGWYEYLEGGISVYKDFIKRKYKTEELIERILGFYEN